MTKVNGYKSLNIGEIHNLFIGLSALEKDDNVKLTGAVRLKIAIDLNRCRPVAEAYETARAKMFAEISKRFAERIAAAEAKGPTQAKPTIAEHELERVLEDQKMRAEVGHVELRTLVQSDLRLEENPRITGAMIAMILPVLEGIE